MFKIRNSAGLFSLGGWEPSFNKIGKTWNKLGYVRSHLSILKSYDRLSWYKDCDIVEYVVMPKVEMTVDQFLNDCVLKKAIRLNVQADEYKKRRRDLYEELKKEFE